MYGGSPMGLHTVHAETELLPIYNIWQIAPSVWLQKSDLFTFDTIKINNLDAKWSTRKVLTEKSAVNVPFPTTAVKLYYSLCWRIAENRPRQE